MPDTWIVLAGTLVLAAGTYAMRLGGAGLRGRLARIAPGRTEHVDEFVDAAAIVLLVAVLATTGLTQDGAFAGIARAGGVGVAVALAWLRVPFVIVILTAAGLTAGLRLAGVT